MAIVTARLKARGHTFEISVDVDQALLVKTGKGNVGAALNSNAIYYDVNKGELVPRAELESVFGTTDLYSIAEQIMKKGEIQKPQEYRDAEREAKIKQVITLILKNAVDQHGKPYTEERLRRAVEESHYSFDNKPVEQQMYALVEKLKTVIPIRLDTKRIKLRIPARFSGQVYGLFKDVKESEEWLSNGDLEVIVNLPAGMQVDFYDKLNGVTHGAVVSEELK